MTISALSGDSVLRTAFDPVTGTLQVEVVGGGSGGGPVTIADGADVTQGARADTAVTNPASAASVIAVLKGLLTEDLPSATGGVGSKTSTTPGAAVRLVASSTPCRWVSISAYEANTKYVAVGLSSSTTASSSGVGIRIPPGGTISLPVTDVTNVYLDNQVSGEGIAFGWGV